jgi:truncated hemoglobin YjbI
MVHFDTYKYTQELEASGIDSVHARAYIRALHDALSEIQSSKAAEVIGGSTMNTASREVTQSLNTLKWQLGMLLLIAYISFITSLL